MKQIFMSLLVGFSIMASSLAVIADDSTAKQDWQNLLQKIAEDGEVIRYQFGDYIVLSELTPDNRDMDHVANYLSLVGGFSNEGVFYLSHLEGVWENWKTDADGNWEVDQWLFKLTQEGELVKTDHYLLVETKQGRVLRHERYTEVDETGAAFWEKLKAGWIQFSKRN